MDLTFHIPMQYCSLQHQTLLPSPVTSTTGCCFCFGSVSSFFMELFLHFSPVAYWASTDLGSSSFSVICFAFHTTHESSKKTPTSALLIMPKPLCGSQQTVKNSYRDGNTRPPYLPPEKSISSSRSNN